MKLLRLRETGDSAVALDCWREAQWQSVAIDEDFAQAFGGADQLPPVAATDADAVPAESGVELAFEAGERAVLLLPGSWVWNGLETVPRAARRQSQAVGYMVEEQLAEDVEDLHFTCEAVNGDLCSVMAVGSLKLATLKAQIERLGWPVTAAIPEYRLLASLEQGSGVWLEPSWAHFWDARGRGLSVQRPLAGVVAESLLEVTDASEQAPEEGGDEVASVAPEGRATLSLLGDATELELATLQQLGEVQVLEKAPEALFLEHLKPSVPGNLLSGAYQVTLQSDEGPWWKKPAIAVVACFVLQLTFFIGAGIYYKVQASNADKQARALFGEIFPGDSASADLRRQITGYLNQASGGGGEFAGQLEQLSGVWGSGNSGGLKLQSLRFDGGRGELVLQLRAANLGQLDSAVNKLGQGQYRAELLAANELENGVSGRIRLR
ncbi:type II secretion system protein GspL [Microbulbifer agarilyticus]|uniref:type II secretion system protein GspL n=1 Tax=Microbulbifer agarilyticus TaxID=260552 RepID=UPI0018DD3F6B|nr:type II secretion system protein GspL [Microbulbifer agarilyticus]